MQDALLINVLCAKLVNLLWMLCVCRGEQI